MKKLWLISMAVIILVAAMVNPAKAQDDNGRQLTFFDVRNYYGKGVVFRFKYKGKFKHYELQNAYAYWNDHEFSLYCNISSEEIISCVAQAGLRKRVGEHITGTVAGYEFSATIPLQRQLAYDYRHCYSVWDYWDFTGGQWADMTDYWGEPWCQENPASVGDILYYSMYQYGDFYWSYTSFSENGSDHCAPNYGPAYYYDDC